MPARSPEEAEAPKTKRRATHGLWGGKLLGGVLGACILVAPSCEQSADETVTPVEIDTPSDPAPVDSLRVQVVERYPHDVSAFTQGLLFDDGVLYESTGQYGQSELRRVRLRDGRVLAERDLDSQFFGEGLARVDDQLIQLTWRSGVAIVSAQSTLQEQRTMEYAGEGWGLCYDGESLVMSNGSATLTFRDPETMDIRRHVTVRQEGVPVSQLNELECVDGDVFANVWRRQDILRIDPASGDVTAVIDARGLLSAEEAGGAGVLNGIAYRADTGTFLVTGKYWPALFEVQFVPQ